MKKAHQTTAPSKVLGADIAPPVVNTAVAKVAPKTTAKPSSPLANGAQTKILKPKGNLSGFGLGAKAITTADTDASKKGLDFGDDDDTKKKLEKLPSLPEANGADPTPVVGEEGDDEGDNDVDMQEEDEEALAAARAAAEQRSKAEQEEDTSMGEAPAPIQADVDVMSEDEEVDPLDAFMNDLVPTSKTSFKSKMTAKLRLQEPEAMFGDDDVNLTAIDEDNPDSIMAAAADKAKKKKKEIPTVNHGKVDYESFRRNFYSEPVEMADWTEDDVAGLRMELENIKVRGVDVPKPVQKWSQCGLGVQVLDVILKSWLRSSNKHSSTSYSGSHVRTGHHWCSQDGLR